MQDTGIVRRIDELGRVVIPKEIRKTLRIKDGDPLQIYTEREELIMKKYSPIVTVGTFAKVVAEGIYEVLGKDCVVTDTDSVVYAVGKNKDLISKKISIELEKVINDRKSVLLSRVDGGNIVNICKDVQLEAENQIIVPIECNGDCFGSFTLFDRDKTQKFTSNDVKLVRFGAIAIAKQFE